MTLRATAALAVCAAAGCQYDPHTAVYTRSRPDPAEVAGVYRPDAATRELVARDGGYGAGDAVITLARDGAFEVVRLPDWWRTDFGRPGGGLDAGRGTWRVERHQEWWIVAAHFESTAGFAPPGGGDGGFAATFMLAGEAPPYRLLLTIGDPDEGRAMQLVRDPRRGD